jgi:hypothetical protein
VAIDRRLAVECARNEFLALKGAEMTQTLQHDFPQSESKVEGLVRGHLEIKDEPLLLALYYAPERDPQDIFVFEVIENFGGDSIDPDRRLFEITHASQTAFPLKMDQELHLVLTNPSELTAALRDQWPSAQEIRDAVKRGDYRIIFEGPNAGKLMEQIRA